MTKILTVLGSTCLTAALCCGQRTPLALEHQGEGCIFLGEYNNGQFTQPPEDLKGDEDGYTKAAKRLLELLPLHKNLSGIDLSGKAAEIIVENVDPAPELSFYSVDVKYQKGSSERGVIFGTFPLPIRLLLSRNASLTPSIERILRSEAEQLWGKHVPERVEEEQPKGFKFRKPTVTQFQEAPDILAVFYPVDIEEQGDAHDDRGSFFFIYSKSARRVVFSKFGHPEWSPGATTLIVKPEMYFRLGSKSDLYFLGTYQGGWEEWGHAIFDLRTGKIVLYCY